MGCIITKMIAYLLIILKYYICRQAGFMSFKSGNLDLIKLECVCLTSQLSEVLFEEQYRKTNGLPVPANVRQCPT